MCQIIALKGERVDIISYLLKNKNKIKKSLDFKGGEGYSLTFLNDANWFSCQTIDFEDLYEDSIERLIKETGNNICHVILFSRQRPEMENEKIPLPPYWDKNKERFVWMHGTISNIEELEKKYKVNVEVDSEILLYTNEEEIQGNYSAIIWNKQQPHVLNILDRGLGFYFYEEDNIIIATTDIFYKSTLKNNLNSFYNPHLIVSFSGGMDISISLIYDILTKAKIGLKYKTVDLLYFDYGARAAEKEKTALFKMRNYLEEILKELNIETKINAEIMEVKGLINDISMIYQQDIKLINENAKPDLKESESTLAYVPFRNSIFVELMGAYAEGKDWDDVTFMLGLNLSEGMVFGDNSEIWLDRINKLIRRAGKSYHRDWHIIAPFYNKTKINMLKEFYKEFGEKTFNDVLNISYSCYYPKKDGSPCGKCGSCLLREEAIKKAKE